MNIRTMHFRKSPSSSVCSILQEPIVGPHKTVVIVGCARGGTSMVAGLVRKLGIFMGENMDGPNQEDQDFMQDDLHLLNAVVEQRNAAHPYWGWKNTDEGINRIERLLPTLRNPHVIVVFRNFLAVSQSFYKYESIDKKECMADIGARYHAITQFIDGLSCPVLAVNYDTAIRHRRETVRELVSFLGITCRRNVFRQAVDFINGKGGYKFIVEPITLMHLQQYTTATQGQPLPLQIKITNAIAQEQGYLGVEQDPQFIISHADKCPFGTQLILKFNAKLPSENANSMLYYSACGIFIEQHSQPLALKDGTNSIALHFSSALKYLRIDPVDTNDYFELSNIEVLLEFPRE